MLKRSILVLFVLAIAATFCYAAQEQPAQEQKPEQTVQPLEQPTATPETKELVGIVDKIDMKKNTISIKDETTNESTAYTFNDTTTFSKEDKSVKASDFKKGDRVAFAVNAENLILNMKNQAKESEQKLPESEQKEKKH